MTRVSDVLRRRLLGVGFIVLVAALLAAAVGAYQKVFTPAVWVTVVADHTGLQVDRNADVKLRGVVVGQVRDISANGQRAKLRLALDPGSVPRIPSNVTATMLPKTLFGEKYVSLDAPARPSGRPITAGAVVHQDRSARAVELERVLDRALPLLKAVPPEKVSATLTALAAALRYTGALPDLMAILRNLTVTSSTVAEQREQLAAFWSDTTGLADTATPFLQRHEGRLIQLGQVSRPLLDVLAEYSPEYPCLTAGAVRLQRNIEGAFDTGRLHITLEITKDSGKYVAGDEPANLADTGPNCRGLPNPAVPYPGGTVADGYQHGASHPGGVLTGGGDPGTAGTGLGGIGGGSGVDMGYAGTSAEQSVVNPLVAAATGRNVTDLGGIDDLLWGPLMRGSVVSVQ
ncbi:MCE family protein [Actinocatenispora sera]|uniref:MCE family protein n=1 Tax=Actinocatenispora sera TaxID=390989 RepID=UPI001470400E|nr:MCE family protein [Actinocatenispora sera]